MKSNRSLLLAFIVMIASGCYSATNAQSNQDNQLLYELLERISLLESELRQLRGDLEMIQHQQTQQSGFNNSTGNGSIEQRLQALERGLTQLLGPGNTATALAPAPANEPDNTDTNTDSTTFSGNWQGNTTTPATPPPNNQSSDLNSTLAPISGVNQTPAPAAALSGLEQDAYNQALEQLRGGRYQQAATGFQTFINNYPNSSLAGNAYYWLGESYYVNRDFEKAKQAFLTLGTQYPNSEKLPDTLLKLGYSYSELGETERSKQVLNKLVETFPDSYAANLAEKHLRLLR